MIGASGDARKNTSRPQRFLRQHGYTGRIVPINRGRNEIFGERAYPDLTSVPDEIDHAFVMVPAVDVPAAIEQCVAKKVRVATVYSDGFAETGSEGRRKQEALEKWQKVLAEDPSWSAESFVKWYKLWNIRDEDSAKLMDGIYRTGVLGAEAKPGM
jgi:acyl-CoA synthetase (NDP forming)